MKKKIKKGFTILELLIVIIIISILATIGFTQYKRAIEIGRRGEARSVLSTLRSAEIAYHFENPSPAPYGSIAQIGVSAPTDCASQSTHYFSYSCDNAGKCCATRCTNGGKPPPVDASEGYTTCLAVEDYFTETGYGRM
ncbi:MAG: prepilin-type N-terminal cleavage/methylation domain-containing protein [Candidatus Omnitrophota bacterium]|jgi:prepilin-type N-terminal cleavage/methylation domain-containing protein